MKLNTKNINRYTALMINNSVSKLNKEVNKNSKELNKIYKNVLLDRKGPRALSGYKLDKEEYFIANKLFRPYMEIMNSFESIQNIPIYISSFPFTSKGISKNNYLKYHIENYLQELYIMQQRLITYLKVIDRAYLKTERSDIVHGKIVILTKVVNNTFDQYSKARGSHVHELRYSDNDIDRLSLFDLLSRSEDTDFSNTMNLGYKLAYKEIRKKWVKKIEDDSNGIIKLLDVYLNVLYKLITKKDKIIYPWDKI